MTATTERWTFNRDYHDLAQVAPFWAAYDARYEELRAAGKYPYNAEFEDLPGICDAMPQPETPVYLLQTLRKVVEGHEAIARDVAAGFERVTTVRTLTESADGRRELRCARIAVYDEHYSRYEYVDARLLAEPDGRLAAILPKGRRTRGRRLLGNERVYLRKT